MLIRHTRASSTVPPLLGGADWDADHTVVPQRRALPGGFYNSGITAALNATLTLAVNRIYMVPMRLPHSMTIDRLGIRITTGVAGATIRLALYDQISADDALGGWPGLLLDSSPDMAAATSNVQAEFSLSRSLSVERQYWLGVWSGAAVAVRSIAPGNAFNIVARDADGATGCPALWRDITYAGGSWPSPWGQTAAQLLASAVAAQNISAPSPTWRAAV